MTPQPAPAARQRVEYLAAVVTPRGGTQTVLVPAFDRAEALRTLTRKGYLNVLWITP